MQSAPELHSLGMIFPYRVTPHVRRHGPSGYRDDEHYKPWLRDEFHYRCLYCCSREVWIPDGDAYFSVEHLLPRSLAEPGLTDYDSLVYACCQCNAVRQALDLPIDPLSGLGQHLRIELSGYLQGITREGDEFIRACRLNRANLITFRQLIISLLNFLRSKEQTDALALCRRYLAYPDNLPDLSALRPPAGNRRPEGVRQSAWALRQGGELPAIAE